MAMVKKYLPKPLEEYPKYDSPADEKELYAAYAEAKAKRDANEPIEPALLKKYGSLEGGLIYLSPTSRADCAFSIALCARPMTFPTERMFFSCPSYHYNSQLDHWAKGASGGTACS